MKSKSFRYLWLGQSLANLGDILYIVGLISVLYGVSESAITLAMLPFLSTFGRFISGILSPLLFAKFRLKFLLVLSQLLKTFVLLGLSLWINFTGEQSLFIVYGFILLIALLDGWAMPATGAMLPRLVQKNEILKANSFISIVLDTIQMAGWAIGGMLVAMINGYNVLWFTLLLFILSSWMMLQLRDPREEDIKENDEKMIILLRHGWVTLWKNRLYRAIHLQITIDTVANVVWIAAILYIFVFEVLHASEAWWGYLNTVFFLGLLAGGVLCSTYAKQVESNLRGVLLLSSFAISLITILFGMNSILVIALILAAIHGFTQQIKGISIDSFLQREASIEELPYIYAAQNALISLVFSFSSLGFGVIAEILHAKIVFYISGFLLLIGALFLSGQRKYFPKYYEGN